MMTLMMHLTALSHGLASQAAAAAAAAPDFGFISSMLRAGIGEQCVMLLLLGISVVSWGIMLHKAQVGVVATAVARAA